MAHAADFGEAETHALGSPSNSRSRSRRPSSRSVSPIFHGLFSRAHWSVSVISGATVRRA